MQEVVVNLGNKIYRYKNTGQFFTWVDDKSRPVPVIIHTKLREKALAEGANPSHFLSSPKPPRSEVVDDPDAKVEKATGKKLNLTGGFNPFNNGGQK